MAIYVTTNNPTIEAVTENRFLVIHPCNGAILAYCDTRKEAERFAEEFKLFANRFRQLKEKYEE